jgi:hypothetical protein
MTANWWRNSALLPESSVSLGREPEYPRLGGCAGSLKPTRLSLQFGKLQGDLAQFAGTMPSHPAETPCISVAWVGFSLIQGAGRPKFLAGKVELETRAGFLRDQPSGHNGHPIANEGCLLHPQERT